MTMNPVSIPEVPMNLDTNLRRFLLGLRQAVVRLQSDTVSAPSPVSNLQAMAKGGGIVVRFTRSDADTYMLIWSATSNRANPTLIDLGTANEYTDEIGKGGIRRWYWVKPKKKQMEGEVAGPASAVSLEPGASVTLPPPPPGSQSMAKSDETGKYEYGRPTPSAFERI